MDEQYILSYRFATKQNTVYKKSSKVKSKRESYIPLPWVEVEDRYIEPSSCYDYSCHFLIPFSWYEPNTICSFFSFVGLDTICSLVFRRTHWFILAFGTKDLYNILYSCW